MFTANDISSRVRQQPFVPMRIKTSNGEAYDIHHPDLIMVGRREVVVGTGTVDDPEHYEQLSRISILHIAAVEDLPVACPATSNGEH